MGPIGLVGNVAFDVVDGQSARSGGAPVFAIRAFERLNVEAAIFTSCDPTDRSELVDPLARPGIDLHWRAGDATARFQHLYSGDGARLTRIAALGPVWSPEHARWIVAQLSPGGWLHVAPLTRLDFPAETLAEIGSGARLSLDGQGLVRVPALGPLELDADYDPDLLRSISVLKLAEEEAAVLGDPADLPVSEVIVTHGARGATIYAGGETAQVHGEAVDCDPTGAGDMFSVSYLASRAAGNAPFAAAKQACDAVSSLLAAS